MYKSPAGVTVLQPVGLAHGPTHADYSQVFRAMGKTGILDGEKVLLEDIAKDPKLFKLLTDEGRPLPSLRHPDYALKAVS
jgi:hypothetical protein